MSEIIRNATIRLSEHRCYECGRWWAVEFIGGSAEGQCPHCAYRKILKANERADQAERSANSLKGALTSARKRLEKRGT